jgi:UDP-N-acetylmuramoyl-L-alanyl-D-glutamate--2,6-diaminopimelate ligase
MRDARVASSPHHVVVYRAHATHLPAFVAYHSAHSPDGIRSILSTLRPITEGELIIVFGCGGNRDNTKRPIMGEIASDLADFVVVTSDNPRFEEPEAIIDMIEPGVKKHDTPYVRIADRREAIAFAMDRAKAGDTILIAGKGHENYQEICGVRHDFDDCQVVRSLAAR